MARRKSKSVEESQHDSYDNLCNLEDDIMNRIKKYQRNREYDDTFGKLANHLRTIVDSKSGLYRNFLVIEEVKELRNIITKIPPEELEKWIPRQNIINPDVIIQSAYT